MFRQLAEGIYASPQIGVAEIAEAKRLGVRLIINNRPDEEAPPPEQTPGDEIAAAAAAAGIAYCAIPVTHAGFSEPQVTAMAEALAGAEGPVLAYCRSGTRSTLLWALAQASKGAAPEALANAAAGAGYDLSPIRPLLEMLATRQA